jgi:pimeloyl-ACP methyl ester carboxylesterase
MRMAIRLVSLMTVCVLAVSSPTLAQDGRLTSFDSNGVRIAYTDRGTGEPVVLLHGFTGSSERHWESPGVIAALETAGYRVIAMDCRGHGQSDKPVDPKQYGLEMVQDVVRLLNLLKIDRAHLVGYSMGGAIVTQLLVRQPARLLTATLLGAGWEGENLQPLRTMMNTLADGFEKNDASALIRGVNAGAASEPTEQQIAELNKSLFARNYGPALAANARTMAALFDIPANRLRATKVPILAIVGDQDLPNLEPVNRLKTAVPHTEVTMLPGANHATSVKPSATVIVAFLNQHRRK